MRQAMLEYFPSADLIVMSAAVGDVKLKITVEKLPAATCYKPAF